MLEIIQFLLDLFTNPLQAIGTIVLVVFLIIGFRWAADRSKYNLPADAEPEAILRHVLKFEDDDLDHNRSGGISPRQLKRIQMEFLALLAGYIFLSIVFYLIIVVYLGDDLFSGDFDLLLVGTGVACIGIPAIVFVAIAGYQLWGYIKELRVKRSFALISELIFEEHETDYLGIKLKTHQYNLIVYDLRLPKPLTLRVGFMSEDLWDRVQKLTLQPAMIYIAPNTSKLLSFELAKEVQTTIHDQ